MITEIEFQEWLENDVTKSFFNVLQKEREEIKETMILGLYAEPEKARGIAEVIQKILDMSYTDIVEQLREQ